MVTSNIDFISSTFNKNRYNELKNRKAFKDELSLLENKKVLAYYQHIIKDVSIDRSNQENSYLLYVYDKVDSIDLKKPCNIIKAFVSLPDVDMDFERCGRKEIIEYAKEKYGKDKVSQMITFSRLQGRGAMKEVLRSYGEISFKEMNKITEWIPDEAEISDQLQVMKEMNQDGEASIIQWALENHSEQLKKWAYIDENGEIQGPLKDRFKQAIRIEGTKKSQSKHAAGIIISSEPLAEVCPMIFDKNAGEPIAGMEMGDLEKAGHVKLDFLGTAVLDKIHGVLDILKYGELKNDVV